MDSITVLGDSQSVRLERMWLRQVRQDCHISFCAGSGWTTARLKCEVRSRIEQFHKLCVLNIGINDILKSVPVDVSKANIKCIVSKLQHKHRTIIISTLPPTLHKPCYTSEPIRNLNVFIQSLHQHPTITVIPFHKDFPPYTSLDPTLYQQRW